MDKYLVICALSVLVLEHTQASPECPEISPKKEYYPDSGDCGQYYQCYEGVLSHHSCDPGLYWDTKADSCKAASSVNCGTRPTTPAATPTTSSKATTSTTSKPTTPASTDTTTSKPTSRSTTPTTTAATTPKPTTLKPSTVTPSSSKATSTTTSKTTHTPTSTTPSTSANSTKSTTTSSKTSTDARSTPNYDPDPTCPATSNNITFYPDPENCKKYFECDRGTRISMICPGDLFWNTRANACDYYRNVDCSGRSTPSMTSTTTPSSSYQPCKDKADGAFTGDPSDCTVFYECVGGSGTARHCQSGLYWCQEEVACDFLNKEGCTCFKQ